MPAKHTVKIYVENGFYHLFNRGVEKRPIFLDRNDYVAFLSILKRYLTNPDDLSSGYLDFSHGVPSRRSDLHTKIQLVSYCLMPNHFPILVKQLTKNAITEFTRRV